eukprot:TRINITY_DN25229_c0_g2_i2.p1 TRINITY_DN25229_c0_g2~~TRINITY_DN25229_c0_g2_i2.p1  ORF type:complete len:241 (+),score=49.45 TRINITY_DN25229_c0_g2_i2:54-725(+)
MNGRLPEDFEELLQEQGNDRCFESGRPNPRWASISHGIFLSIEASGVHRGLGVQLSTVKSLELDEWPEDSLRMMRLGGNARFREFLESQGVGDDMPVAQKYATRAADWYRRNLRRLANDQPPLEPLPAGEGALPSPSEIRMPDDGINALIADIDALPSLTLASVEQVGEQRECKICLDAFEPGDYIKTLACGHMLHGPCCEQWFQSNWGCIVCGGPLRPDFAP